MEGDFADMTAGTGDPQREMSRHYVTSFDVMQLTKSLIR